MGDEMDLTNVRRRPGMYIGDIDDGSGLQNMVREVVSFAIRDVVRAGSGRIDVVLNSDGSCVVRDDVVRDDGWGLSAKPGEKFAAPEDVLTSLHSRAAFDLEEAWAGHKGVGVCVVNALSEWLSIRVWQDGEEHFMRFRQGVAEAPLALVGSAQKRGTEFRFRPDPEIFRDLAIDRGAITAWLRASDMPSVPITFGLAASEDAEASRITLSCTNGSFV
jgi:DNA gyrase subunit B